MWLHYLCMNCTFPFGHKAFALDKKIGGKMLICYGVHFLKTHDPGLRRQLCEHGGI